MPQFIAQVTNGTIKKEIPVNAGDNLRALLDTVKDLRPKARCRGIGRCGLCRVRIDAGAVSPPSKNELMQISERNVAAGVRLACQTFLFGDAAITVLNPEKDSCWESIPNMFAIHETDKCSQTMCEQFLTRYGVGVDIGTTHIVVAVGDMNKGTIVATRRGKNPQVQEGADIMSRLQFAVDSHANAEKMRDYVLIAIRDCLRDIALRENIRLQNITHAIIVGNTAMLALFTGRNFGDLLHPPQWTLPLDVQPDDTGPFTELWEVSSDANIEVIPAVGGFIGSDLLMDLIATHFGADRGAILLIDFGTNSEIALYARGRLLVTSAAGGPAFECSGMNCGMPAESGAIYAVYSPSDTLEDARYSILYGQSPQGICGTGLVDLLALLIISGKINPRGQIQTGALRDSIRLAELGDLILSAHDIDLFQQAKAAIGTGTQILLSEMNLSAGDLDRVVVTGAFGLGLNVTNAIQIGMLPNLAPSKFELFEYGAVKGCIDLLFSPSARQMLREFLETAVIINLAQHADFETKYLENLYLQPQEG